MKCPIPRARRRVALVDTPAFNHGGVEIAEIEKMIKRSLKEMYVNLSAILTAACRRIAGISARPKLREYCTSDVGMTENPIRHLDTFHELRGGN